MTHKGNALTTGRFPAARGGARALALLLALASSAAAQGNLAGRSITVALGPESTVMEGGIFPYMLRTREGTLVVAGTLLRPNPESYTGPDYKWDIPRIVRSTDGGRSWTAWTPAPGQGEGPVISGCTVQLRSGTILIFDYYTRGIGNGKFEGRMWRSDDQWQTLSGPERFLVDLPQAKQSLGDDRGDTVPTGILWHRAIVELPGGDLLAGIYGAFEEDKAPSQYLPSMQKFRAFALRSRDGGKSWSLLSTIAAGPVGQEGFNEPVILRLDRGRRAGRLICLMRTGRENPLYQSESDDDGATWSQARPLRWMFSKWGQWRDIVGVDPDLVEMSNGVLACSFGHKPDFKDDGIFVAFSLDQGETWTAVTRLAMDITGAYTTVREIAPSKLLVVYDKRDGHYRSRSRRILSRTVDVKLD